MAERSRWLHQRDDEFRLHVRAFLTHHRYHAGQPVLAQPPDRGEERRDFHLYVDEFQSIVTDSFISILSEARKYRLCLTLSHQYLDQLRPEILNAVFGNVGSMVAFRVGQRDAKVLEEAFGDSFPSSQFSGLNNFEVYAKLLSCGQDVEPFLGRTFPLQGTRYERRETIIRRSREKYAAKRERIERKINLWMTNRRPTKQTIH